MVIRARIFLNMFSSQKANKPWNTVEKNINGNELRIELQTFKKNPGISDLVGCRKFGAYTEKLRANPASCARFYSD